MHRYVQLEMLKSTDIFFFDWDEANSSKNWEKHGVSTKECEEIFFNKPQQFLIDEKHSQQEPRFVLFGWTRRKRCLLVVFTIRRNKIRVISARDQNKKEKSYFLKLNNAN